MIIKQKELPQTEMCVCGNCVAHNSVVMTMEILDPEFDDYELTFSFDGCCGNCEYARSHEEELRERVVVVYPGELPSRGEYINIPAISRTYKFGYRLTSNYNEMTGDYSTSLWTTRLHVLSKNIT